MHAKSKENPPAVHAARTGTSCTEGMPVADREPQPVLHLPAHQHLRATHWRLLGFARHESARHDRKRSTPLPHCSVWSTGGLLARRWLGRGSWEFLQRSDTVWTTHKTSRPPPPRGRQLSTGEETRARRHTNYRHTQTKRNRRGTTRETTLALEVAHPRKTPVALPFRRPQLTSFPDDTPLFLSTYALKERVQFSRRPQGVTTTPSNTRLFTFFPHFLLLLSTPNQVPSPPTSLRDFVPLVLYTECLLWESIFVVVFYFN